VDDAWCATWGLTRDQALGATLGKLLAGPSSSNGEVGSMLKEATRDGRVDLAGWVDCGIVTNFTAAYVPLRHHLVIGPVCDSAGAASRLVGVSRVLPPHEQFPEAEARALTAQAHADQEAALHRGSALAPALAREVSFPLDDSNADSGGAEEMPLFVLYADKEGAKAALQAAFRLPWSDAWTHERFRHIPLVTKAGIRASHLLEQQDPRPVPVKQCNRVRATDAPAQPRRVLPTAPVLVHTMLDVHVPNEADEEHDTTDPLLATSHSLAATAPSPPGAPGPPERRSPPHERNAPPAAPAPAELSLPLSLTRRAQSVSDARSSSPQLLEASPPKRAATAPQPTTSTVRANELARPPRTSGARRMVWHTAEGETSAVSAEATEMLAQPAASADMDDLIDLRVLGGCGSGNVPRHHRHHGAGRWMHGGRRGDAASSPRNLLEEVYVGVPAIFGSVSLYTSMLAATFIGLGGENEHLLPSERAAALCTGLVLAASALVCIRRVATASKAIPAVAMLIINVIASSANLLMGTIGTPILVDPITGTSEYMVRWCEWGTLGFLMTFVAGATSARTVTQPLALALVIGLSCACGYLFPFLSSIWARSALTAFAIGAYLPIMPHARWPRDEPKMSPETAVSRKMVVTCAAMATAIIVDYLINNALAMAMGPRYQSGPNRPQWPFIVDCAIDVTTKLLLTSLAARVSTEAPEATLTAGIAATRPRAPQVIAATPIAAATGVASMAVPVPTGGEHVRRRTERASDGTKAD